MNICTSILLQPGNPEMQDRVEIHRLDGRIIIALADGAGGISGGAQAAELFMRLVGESSAGLMTPDDCTRLLMRIDQQVANAPECGETTGVVVIINSENAFGASVGDSMAWSFSPEGRSELTHGQQRKPFLGTGMASVRSFARSGNRGTIVIASDGLWKYTSMEMIEQKVHGPDASSIANQLADLVRLRSGAFPDDIAIASCRILP